MWQRPWRWLMALVVATVLIGLLNQAGLALGTSEYFGIGTAGRLIIFAGGTVLLSAFVIPSHEKMDRGDPLPPLPHIQPRSVDVEQRSRDRQTPQPDRERAGMFR
jgi:hypothetical protein